MDELEAITAELAAEYHRNRTARSVSMRHEAEDRTRLGALWWRGGPDDAVVTMQSGRHRLTYSVADWERFGWTIAAMERP